MNKRIKAANMVGEVLKNNDEFRQKAFIALGEILLEEGEEPAFREKSQREKAAYMVGKVLKADNEFWHKVIIDLCEMPDQEWDLIQKVVEKLK